VIALGLLICLFYAQVLDAFAFGDEAAASLGVNVGRARIVLFALTAMMTATIVSMVGSIGFVGLVVPHAARFLVGPLHIRLLPACAIGGAIFMVLADIASRALVPQQVLPIGVVTALVGVPFFSIILYRFQRAS
jgi:iron complex transport system permease protein